MINAANNSSKLSCHPRNLLSGINRIGRFPLKDCGNDIRLHEDDGRISVHIEGAGIAGQVLHRELSLRGIPSRLTDRAKFPREKVCGGVLQWDSWQYLKSRFGLEYRPKLIESVSHYWRGQKIATHRLPKPMVYVPRVSLDEALWKHRPCPGTISSGTLRVSAKGASHGSEGDWLGFQACSAPVNDLEMHYGRGICAGISPVPEGNSHLAFIVRRDRFRRAADLEIFLSEELKIRVIGPLKGTGRIRYGYTQDPLAVGDAKLTTFPFLGLGMKHAILSSRLLAEKISQKDIPSYGAAHRRQFRKYRLFSALVGKIYDSPFQLALKMLIRNEFLFLRAYRWLHGNSDD